jgi:hypothetical protein
MSTTGKPRLQVMWGPEKGRTDIVEGVGFEVAVTRPIDQSRLAKRLVTDRPIDRWRPEDQQTKDTTRRGSEVKWKDVSFSEYTVLKE